MQIENDAAKTFTLSDKLDNLILKYARAVDDIDMYLSPMSTLALWHNNHTVHKLGIALAAADLALLKTPFVALYVVKTGDYKSAVEWLGWETLAHVIPYEGGCLNIRRNYEKSTNEYYNNLNKKKMRKNQENNL